MSLNNRSKLPIMASLIVGVTALAFFTVNHTVNSIAESKPRVTEKKKSPNIRDRANASDDSIKKNKRPTNTKIKKRPQKNNRAKSRALSNKNRLNKNKASTRKIDTSQPTRRVKSSVNKRKRKYTPPKIREPKRERLNASADRFPEDLDLDPDEKRMIEEEFEKRKRALEEMDRDDMPFGFEDFDEEDFPDDRNFDPGDSNFESQKIDRENLDEDQRAEDYEYDSDYDESRADGDPKDSESGDSVAYYEDEEDIDGELIEDLLIDFFEENVAEADEYYDGDEPFDYEYGFEDDY